MKRQNEEVSKSPTIDQDLFQEACSNMIGALRAQNGIGTLKEKTIHSVLKYYYAPNPAYHEIRIGSYVADICVDGEIYEVQTRHFHVMRNKLEEFLKEHEVTIIYPVARTKWISWLDLETGELTGKRKSPKKGTFYQIIPELYKIKMFLSNPKLHFIIALLEVEETRYLNGWSQNKKKGSSRMDGIPKALYEEVRIDSFEDYRQFFPESLPAEFTSKEYAQCVHISQRYASTGLNVFLETGIISRIGKKGNSYIYQLESKINGNPTQKISE